MNESISVAELAHEFGHTDEGRAIRVFLRNPDDGNGPFSGHLFSTLWRLSPEQAERVRRRFT
ncbi:MAG: hypothetical protein ACQEWM_06135 [Actinomycetota bacterium]